MTPTMRSLADDLRGRSPEALVDLLAARPDLTHPLPADISALAQRAAGLPSVSRLLDGYDELMLTVALAAGIMPEPIDGDLLADMLDVIDAPSVAAMLDRMRVQGIVWGAPGDLHTVGAVRDLLIPPDLGPHLGALMPKVAEFAQNPAKLMDLLSTAPAGVSPALAQLVAGPVIGTVINARRVVSSQDARSPVDWLLAHQILVPIGDDRVCLPAEVVAILRAPEPRTAVQTIPSLHPPVDRRAAVPISQVDASAAATAGIAVRRMADLGAAWADSPPGVLRNGGLSARNLTTTARTLATTLETALLLAETGYAAGILGTSPAPANCFLPTPAFDRWLVSDAPQRWAQMVVAWLGMARQVHAPAGEGAINAFSAAGVAPGLPALRIEVLSTLIGSLTPLDDDLVLERLRWHAPRRRGAKRTAAARAILAEARELGLTADGVLSTAGHTLIATASAGEAAAETVARAAREAFPEPVNHVILAGDLTAIVPGPPSPSLEAFLRVISQAESIGAASTFRFSQESIRAGLDQGYSAAEIISGLATFSTTALPQPLEFLINEAGRRHGALRVGSARAYLRCDDPVIIAALLNDTATRALGLLQIAPNALVSSSDPEELMSAARIAGLSPVAESVDGKSIPEGTLARRAKPRPTPRPTPDPTEAPSLAMLSAAVRSITAGQRAAEMDSSPNTPAPEIPVTPLREVVAQIRATMLAGGAMWVSYADSAGVTSSRIIDPIVISGGYLSAYDHRDAMLRQFAVARIAGVLAMS